LEEMINQLKDFSPAWQLHADKSVELETRLFNDKTVTDKTLLYGKAFMQEIFTEYLAY